jgi:pyocin large subunit-like protein
MERRKFDPQNLHKIWQISKVPAASTSGQIMFTAEEQLDNAFAAKEQTCQVNGV